MLLHLDHWMCACLCVRVICGAQEQPGNVQEPGDLLYTLEQSSAEPSIPSCLLQSGRIISAHRSLMDRSNFNMLFPFACCQCHECPHNELTNCKNRARLARQQLPQPQKGMQAQIKLKLSFLPGICKTDALPVWRRRGSPSSLVQCGLWLPRLPFHPAVALAVGLLVHPCCESSSAPHPRTLQEPASLASTGATQSPLETR